MRYVRTTVRELPGWSVEQPTDEPYPHRSHETTYAIYVDRHSAPMHLPGDMQVEAFFHDDGRLAEFRAWSEHGATSIWGDPAEPNDGGPEAGGPR